MAITIVVSEPIRPYLEAVDGFREVLEANYNIVHLKDKEIKSDPSTDLWVAVGPQAMRELWQHRDISRKIYMMVSHPEKVVESKDSPCGISLDLPCSFQLQVLHQTFPKIKRVGVLYDPRSNQGTVDDIRQTALSLGISLTALKVEDQKDIPNVLKSNWSKLDVLWLIPDHTVTSEEAMNKHLTEESIRHNVALLGYNSSFSKYGAALAFVIDYQELGQKTAQLARSLTKEDFCWSMIPPARLWVKSGALKLLGWDTPKLSMPFAELK